MRTLRFMALVALALASLPALGDARVVFGLHFGVPLYWPEPYYAPYYYPGPPYFYVPPPGTVPPYEAPAAPMRPSLGWYYYCAQSKAYYPYVRECPGGWERVPTVPAG